MSGRTDLPQLSCPFAPHCQWRSVPLPVEQALQLVQQHVQVVHQTVAAPAAPPSYEQAVQLPGPVVSAPPSLQISFPSTQQQAQSNPATPPILEPLSNPSLETLSCLFVLSCQSIKR